jgi:hypothetical protein
VAMMVSTPARSSTNFEMSTLVLVDCELVLLLLMLGELGVVVEDLCLHRIVCSPSTTSGGVAGGIGSFE